MKYLNKNNEQYIISFLNENSNILNLLFDNKENINVINNIDIVTDLKENSLFVNQLRNNNIDYYYCKFKNIPELLLSDELKKPYTLVITNKDCLITKSLDEQFIDKFNNLNTDVIFAAMSSIYPLDFNGFNIKFPLIESFDRYINSSICFGYKDVIARIFKLIQNNNIFFDMPKNPDFNNLIEKNNDKQIISSNFINNLKIDSYGDYNNNFFSSIYSSNTQLIEKRGVTYVKQTTFFDRNNLLIF